MIDIQEVIGKESSLQRWNELGFTEGFDGDKEKELSLCFESIAQAIIERQKDGDAEQYTNITTTDAFPIAKRLFIIKDYLEYLLSNPKVYLDSVDEFSKPYAKEANTFGDIDKEAECCVGFCKDMCDKAIDFFNANK